MLLSATFKDESIESDIKKNGYVLIKNFLPQEKTKKLLALYKSLHLHKPGESFMWNTLYNLDPERSASVSKLIIDIIEPYLNEILSIYTLQVASFMIKNPVTEGTCNLHRDYSVLDESKFEYRNIWLPLIDITDKNGALFALKESHTRFNYPLPMFCEWPYKHMEADLLKDIDVFHVNAGDMIVYCDRTLHGSFPNLSNEPRPVVHAGLMHPKYELRYYYMDAVNRVKVYKVPYSFFFQNNFGDQDNKYPLDFTFEYSPPPMQTIL